MPVSLLQVGEHLSLEFESGDLPRVRDYLKAKFPNLKTEFHGISTTVQFGGEEFTFQDFWDDPCLIAGTAKGDEILRSIFSGLNADPAEPTG